MPVGPLVARALASTCPAFTTTEEAFVDFAAALDGWNDAEAQLYAEWLRMESEACAGESVVSATSDTATCGGAGSTESLTFHVGCTLDVDGVDAAGDVDVERADNAADFCDPFDRGSESIVWSDVTISGLAVSAQYTASYDTDRGLDAETWRGDLSVLWSDGTSFTANDVTKSQNDYASTMEVSSVSLTMSLPSCGAEFEYLAETGYLEDDHYRLTSPDHEIAVQWPYVPDCGDSYHLGWATFDGVGYAVDRSTWAVAADDDADGAYAGYADCDDADPTTNECAAERCDGKDNDCNSVIDDEFRSFPDGDGDGYGNDAGVVIDCGGVPEGYVGVGGDCDDADPAINPSARDLCGAEVDEDCDGRDDGSGWADDDGDGYGGDRGAPCTLDSTVANTDDCDDAALDVHPGGTEVQDGKDNDCNGVVDDLPVDSGSPDDGRDTDFSDGRDSAVTRQDGAAREGQDGACGCAASPLWRGNAGLFPVGLIVALVSLRRRRTRGAASAWVQVRQPSPLNRVCAC